MLARESQLITLVEGPAPVTLLAGVAEECLGPRPAWAESARLQGLALMGLGFARGGQGRLDEARELLDRSAAILERLHPVRAMETWFVRGRFELWAGKSDAAERALRRACELGEAAPARTLHMRWTSPPSSHSTITPTGPCSGWSERTCRGP